MRVLAPLAALWISATSAWADPDIDRLIDVAAMPALLQVFATEGVAAGVELDTTFLNGQGGAVWAETVRKLYDPTRLEAELRSGLTEVLDPEVARIGLLFLDSDLGQRITMLEVQGREAMLDTDVRDMAIAAGAQARAAVTTLIDDRNLGVRNTDLAMDARAAFFDGMAETVPTPFDMPDIEAQRGAVRAATDAWLKGYYALVLSALTPEETRTYTDFWNTEIGGALDEAVSEVFGQSYVALSFGLGQAVGRLMLPDEL
mmetsp:Transcript_23869/g.43247  ORF Transcript_23869/g.43247 Transcript_23869/m.43247 type:complete len:259 (-) Transcript_23869:3464-4240(-)